MAFSIECEYKGTTTTDVLESICVGWRLKIERIPAFFAHHLIIL